MVETKPDVFAEVLRRLGVIEAEVDAIRVELHETRKAMDKAEDKGSAGEGDDGRGE